MHTIARARTVRPVRPHQSSRRHASARRVRPRPVGNARARMRPLFFVTSTRHVESVSVATEILRGATALAGITAWGVLLLILAG